MARSTERAVRAAIFTAMAKQIHISQVSDDAYALRSLDFDEWWMSRFREKASLTDEQPEHVVLALCFMAAMVEAGDA